MARMSYEADANDCHIWQKARNNSRGARQCRPCDAIRARKGVRLALV